MQLNEWMAKHGIDNDTISADYRKDQPRRQHRTAKSFDNYRYHQRTPPPDVIAWLTDYTDGEVTISDWTTKAIAAA